MLSSGELLLIIVIAFLVFGPDKLPELAKTLGKWLYEIRKGMHDVTAEIENEAHEKEKKQENDISNPLPGEQKNPDDESVSSKVKDKE